MHKRFAIASFVAPLFFCGAAHAYTITYDGFADPSGLTFKGNAATAVTGDGTVLRVTPATGNQAGAAYSSSAVALGSNATFSTQFQFRFTSPGGVDPADGITFVLAASTTGLGTAGYGMGYEGVANSIAIEFDTYNNGIAGGSLGYFAQEPNSSNHVALDLAGSLTNTAATNVYGNGSCGFNPGTPTQNPNSASGCMSNGHLWTATVLYDGTTQKLNVTLFDPSEGTTFAALTDYTIDIASYLGTNDAYVGFTGSSGAGWENQDIIKWTFANTATLPPVDNGVPEPLTLSLFGAGLAGAAAARRAKKRN